MRFVENHNKQRSAQEIPTKTMRLAHAFIYTILGVLPLYNGEEIGLDHRLTLFDKDTINWSAGDDDFYRYQIQF